MSYIKNITIKDSVRGAIDYIMNPEKNNNGEYVQYGGTPPAFADKLWELTRKKYNKDDKVKAHHFVQSFDPKHNVTIEEAMKVSKELAEEQFGKYGFEYIISTHLDTLVFDENGKTISGTTYKSGMKLFNYKGKEITPGSLKLKDGDRIGGTIHNHILVNSVSSTTGKKYQHNNSRDFKKNPNSYVRLRQLNIDVCRKNGIPAVDQKKVAEIIEEKSSIKEDVKLSKKYTSVPYIKTKAYDSWSEREMNNKGKIKKDIDEAILLSKSWEEYIQIMNDKGYEVDWKTKSGEPKKFVTYKMKGMERGRRDRMLNFKNKNGEIVDRYSRQAIEERIERNNNRIDTISKINISFKRVTVRRVKYRGNRYMGNQYILHPKYRIRRVLGKTIITKRSSFERIYIMLFMKCKNSNPQSNNTAHIYDKGRIKQITEEMQRSIRRYETMSENHLYTKEDVRDYTLQCKIALAKNQKDRDSLKVKIKENDKIEDLLYIRDAYKTTYDEYNSLDGAEQTKFFYSKKEHIQRYTYAVRELTRLNLQDSDIEETKKIKAQLHNEMKELVKENNNIEETLSDLSIIELQIEQIRGNAKTEENTIEKKKKAEEDR